MSQSIKFGRICFLFLLIYQTVIANGQDTALLNCADVKNGTFNYFDKKENASETFIRKGAIQKEIIPKRRETIFWEVNWLNECTYTLKYQSGGENRTKAEQKLLSKHLIVVEMLHVTADYVTFRAALDKVTNPDVLNDTLWISQRQSAKNKFVNPRADSIAASKNRIIDSTQASYATLYVYRPGKFLYYNVAYDLLINGQKACVITNGCRYVLKLSKPGMYTIAAKLRGDQSVMLNVKPGGIYYIQCTATMSLKHHKEVQIMDNKQGAAEFNSSEKATQ